MRFGFIIIRWIIEKKYILRTYQYCRRLQCSLLILFLTVLRAGFWRGEVIVEEMFEEEKTCLKGEENSE